MTFTLAHAAATHWGTAAKACLEGLGPAAIGANLGLIYASEDFADHLPSILTFLRETTRIAYWSGAAAPGVIAGGREYRDGGALAVMVGRLPEGSFRCFRGADAAGAGAIVHASPSDPRVGDTLATLAGGVGTVAGGLVSAAGPAAQIADTVVAEGLSGLHLTSPLVCGLTQGCTPIGPEHEVTGVHDGVLTALDGRPALDVLKDEAGDLIARDIRRAAGYIHLAVPGPGGGHDYLVRSLIGIDRRQGWLAVGGSLRPGEAVMFVRRDANGAQADMRRMLDGVRTTLAGRPAQAAVYFSCVARGRYMFGEDGAEAAMVRDALGGAPLIGCFANGEIAGGRLYAYTGVLAVIAGEDP